MAQLRRMGTHCRAADRLTLPSLEKTIQALHEVVPSRLIHIVDFGSDEGCISAPDILLVWKGVKLLHEDVADPWGVDMKRSIFSS